MKHPHLAEARLRSIVKMLDEQFRYLGLPTHMWEGIENYMMRGIRPGSFLDGVLCNDFSKGILHADSTNSYRLRDWALFLQHFPAGSVGSNEIVNNWIGGFKNA